MSIKDDLNNVRVWAQDKINAGQEPPWAWYQYMKLVETIDAIQASMGTIDTKRERPDTSNDITMPM